ncbi:hypothetical protein PsorP6_006027 [Peronosclerospora sorghi]|uniref:Uncharacterized protein n=1 Tax=Peronosclerospora sorghi TaxID=230839 RepID=A0ACC0W5M4_9STRA|nr:hypothetical protein PsorP6_006027 [Peronosclerospora sorghi]
MAREWRCFVEKSTMDVGLRDLWWSQRFFNQYFVDFFAGGEQVFFLAVKFLALRLFKSLTRRISFAHCHFGDIYPVSRSIVDNLNRNSLDSNFFCVNSSEYEMRNPLDNHKKELTDKPMRGSFRYFLTVVPTEYTFLPANRINTIHLSVMEHFHKITAVVSFSYTLSLIMFRIEQNRVDFHQFLTRVCAIVGGVLTMLGIMGLLAFELLNKMNSTPLL